MDIIFVKVGKAIDWMEIDTDDENNKDFMDQVIEPFLDLTINAKTDSKTASTKFNFQDKKGKKYSENVKNLVSGGMKVYYGDSDTQPNLTIFLPDRAEGMAESLVDCIVDYIWDKQHPTQQAA